MPKLSWSPSRCRHHAATRQARSPAGRRTPSPRGEPTERGKINDRSPYEDRPVPIFNTNLPQRYFHTPKKSKPLAMACSPCRKASGATHDPSTLEYLHQSIRHRPDLALEGRVTRIILQKIPNRSSLPPPRKFRDTRNVRCQQAKRQTQDQSSENNGQLNVTQRTTISDQPTRHLNFIGRNDNLTMAHRTGGGGSQEPSTLDETWGWGWPRPIAAGQGFDQHTRRSARVPGIGHRRAERGSMAVRA